MNAWREVRVSPRLLGALALAFLALAAFRYWEVRGTATGPGPSALVPRPDLLVEPEWLARRLSDSQLRIVDLRRLYDYQAGHIPGAVYVEIDELFVERDGVQGMLPPMPRVESLLRRAGIGAGTVVVAYDAVGGLNAARLFWALDVVGQGNGRVLNGGWDEWNARGLPVATEETQVKPSDFRAAPQPERVADLEWMKAHLGEADTVLLDARSPEEFAGTRGNARRTGHIPGAVSLEWREHLVPGTQRFRAPEELLALLTARGITPEREVVPYCQTFSRAAHSYFTLRWLGFPNVRGYDGSWAEWGNRDDTPIDKGPPKALPQASAGAPVALPQARSGAPAGGASELRTGLTEAQVLQVLGEPQERDTQNPCWGRQSVWRYPATQAGAPLRLTFLDGVLKEIAR